MIDFLINAISGGIAYDGVKIILGGTFNELENYSKNNNIQKLKLSLQNILDTDHNISRKLKILKDQSNSNNQNINNNSPIEKQINIKNFHGKLNM